MSEIQPPSPQPPQPSQPLAPSATTTAAAAKPAVPDTKPEEQAHTLPVDPPALEAAMEQLQNYVQSMQRSLEFSVDTESNRTVVRVVDTNTGDLIRQLPDQAVLELARRLKTDSDVHLLDALG